MWKEIMEISDNCEDDKDAGTMKQSMSATQSITLVMLLTASFSGLLLLMR